MRIVFETDNIERKIEIYIQIFNELVNRNLDSAMLFAERANNMLGELESNTSISDVYVNLGNVYRARGNHTLSLDYYFKAKRILEKMVEDGPGSIDTKLKLSHIYSFIGVNYFY